MTDIVCAPALPEDPEEAALVVVEPAELVELFDGVPVPGEDALVLLLDGAPVLALT